MIITTLRVRPYYAAETGQWGTEMNYVLDGQACCARVASPMDAKGAMSWLLSRERRFADEQNRSG